MPRRSRSLAAREPSPVYTVERPVLVDSNVWIDVFQRDVQWFEWSAQQLAPLVGERRVVINPIVYAEIAASFEGIEQLDGALAPFRVWREGLPWEAAFLTSRAFLLYRSRGGIKRSPLPDFYIGAHASLAGFALLTRDAARYRDYFPKLEVIAPD
jgi:predicted nucleic acid-binding protein